MRKYFGTDGIRGLANRYPMTPDFFVKLGQVIGIYFQTQNPHSKILIGKDTRRSGYMLELALASGICSVGCDVWLLGPLPTPGIAYLTRGLRASAGIVLSASHNPYYDNGIKIFGSDGFKLPDEVELKIEKMMTEDISNYLATGGKIGRTRFVSDAIGQYSVFLKEQFPKDLSLEKLRIVLDPAHGAGYKVGPKVLSELGAEVMMINDQPNGVNINDQCGALHPDQIRHDVLKYRADIGLALDGDADRLVAIDELGNIVDGDAILAICAIDMLQKQTLNKDTVVATTMSNLGLQKAIAPFGGKVVTTQVGDRYIIKEMKENQYCFGGEKSGHLVFGNISTTGDALLAGLKLIQIMIEQNKKLSELAAAFKPVPQILKNVSVSSKKPLDQMPKLSELLEDLKQTFAGRVVFRYSGTENLARVMVEGDDQFEIEKIADQIILQLEEEL